jgi:hypothetical protein
MAPGPVPLLVVLGCIAAIVVLAAIGYLSGKTYEAEALRRRFPATPPAPPRCASRARHP